MFLVAEYEGIPCVLLKTEGRKEIRQGLRERKNEGEKKKKINPKWERAMGLRVFGNNIRLYILNLLLLINNRYP